MPQTHTNTIPFHTFIGLAGHIGRSIGQLLPVTALLYVTILPAPALLQANIFPSTRVLSPEHIAVTDSPASGTARPGMVLGVATTAYSSTVGQTDSDPFTTASGTRVRPGVAAANFLPLGTKIRLNGRMYVIEDRMNARYNNTYRVDVWMDSTEDARQYGNQNQVIQILSLP